MAQHAKQILSTFEMSVQIFRAILIPVKIDFGKNSMISIFDKESGNGKQ